MTKYEALFEKIAETLSQPNGIVQVSTYTRSTVYESKHLPFFSYNATGVYVKKGKSSVAINFCSIRFGKIVEGGK